MEYFNSNTIMGAAGLLLTSSMLFWRYVSLDKEFKKESQRQLKSLHEKIDRIQQTLTHQEENK